MTKAKIIDFRFFFRREEMNNAMQLKAIMENISKDKHISTQLILQNDMLERLLERISMSPYQSNK